MSLREGMQQEIPTAKGLLRWPRISLRLQRSLHARRQRREQVQTGSRLNRIHTRAVGTPT